MVAATAVDVAVLGTGADAIPAGNLQVVLGTIYGKVIYAVQASGEAKGTAEWAAGQVGFLDYHLRQIAGLVSYTVPPAP